MPLKLLDIGRTAVVDVSPLAESSEGQALTLNLAPEKIQAGMDLLRANPRIKGFQVRSQQTMTPEEFWKRYDAGYFSP